MMPSAQAWNNPAGVSSFFGMLAAIAAKAVLRAIATNQGMSAFMANPPARIDLGKTNVGKEVSRLSYVTIGLSSSVFALKETF